MTTHRDRRRRSPWWARAGFGLCAAAASAGIGCQAVEMKPEAIQSGRVDRAQGWGSEVEAATVRERSDASPLPDGRGSDSTRSRASKPRDHAELPAPHRVPDDPVGQPLPESTIDLTAALQLAGVDNPTINLAREMIREAIARELAACSLMIPSVNVGGNFRLHRGAFQDDPGFLRRPNLQGLFLGAGAGAIGAGALAFPGVWLFAHLGDALYEPLVARQRVAVREADSRAVQNAILLDVATAYLELVGAEARLAVLRRAESDVGEIVRVTTAFAETGQGAPANMNRSAAHSGLIRRQARGTEGEIAAASAQLCRLLMLDPSVRLRTPGGPVEAFRIVPEGSDLESLVGRALQTRPELAARNAAILEAEARAKQERTRPWLPLLSVGYSGGAMGGGSNLVETDFGSLKGRSDLVVFAVWTAQNLGVGNCARIRRADAVVGVSIAEQEVVLNQVRREVAEAQAAARTAAMQNLAACRALANAEEGLRLEQERIRKGQGRPIEALDSFQQLVDARLDLLRSVVAFDVAQFRLWVALGLTPTVGPSSKAFPADLCDFQPPTERGDEPLRRENPGAR